MARASAEDLRAALAADEFNEAVRGFLREQRH